MATFRMVELTGFDNPGLVANLLRLDARLARISFWSPARRAGDPAL